MRDLRQFDIFRIEHPFAGWGDHECGLFLIPHKGVSLKVLATVGFGWEHVSVSLPNRCPTWGEMEHVAAMFFAAHEDAMQLHVPAEDHVSYHPFCLHWWRPMGEVKIPRPPSEMVGPKNAEVSK